MVDSATSNGYHINLVWSLYYSSYENDFIYYNENGAHYVSPISSPGPNAIPSDILSFWPLPATLLFIWAPLGFRGTCYYGRRVFYRSLLANPAGCAVDKPIKSYNGENALPFIIMNSHRYFLYLAIMGYKEWKRQNEDTFI